MLSKTRPAITIGGKEVDYEDLTANEKIAYDLLTKLEGEGYNHPPIDLNTGKPKLESDETK